MVAGGAGGVMATALASVGIADALPSAFAKSDGPATMSGPADGAVATAAAVPAATGPEVAFCAAGGGAARCVPAWAGPAGDGVEELAGLTVPFAEVPVAARRGGRSSWSSVACAGRPARTGTDGDVMPFAAAALADTGNDVRPFAARREGVATAGVDVPPGSAGGPASAATGGDVVPFVSATLAGTGNVVGTPAATEEAFAALGVDVAAGRAGWLAPVGLWAGDSCANACGPPTRLAVPGALLWRGAADTAAEFALWWDCGTAESAPEGGGWLGAAGFCSRLAAAGPCLETPGGDEVPGAIGKFGAVLPVGTARWGDCGTAESAPEGGGWLGAAGFCSRLAAAGPCPEAPGGGEVPGAIGKFGAVLPVGTARWGDCGTAQSAPECGGLLGAVVGFCSSLAAAGPCPEAPGGGEVPGATGKFGAVLPIGMARRRDCGFAGSVPEAGGWLGAVGFWPPFAAAGSGTWPACGCPSVAACAIAHSSANPPASLAAARGEAAAAVTSALPDAVVAVATAGTDTRPVVLTGGAIAAYSRPSMSPIRTSISSRPAPIPNHAALPASVPSGAMR